MRVNYVTLSDERMPAYRYRMKIPGEYIGNYIITPRPVEADIHFFSKPYFSDPVLLTAYLKMASRTKFVLDICDDIFKRESAVPEYMKKMAYWAAAITVPTEVMRQRVKEETGRDAIIIEDPCEFEERPIKDISDPKVMWFGTPQNACTFSNVHLDFPIEIVSTKKEEFDRYIQNYTFVEWSLEAMKDAFSRNNIVVIPSRKERNNAQNWMGKSPNRVIESIRNGLSVVAAPVPSYKQFDITLDWDIARGLKNIKQTTPEMQRYVDDNFSKSAIGEQWKQLFRKVLSDSILDAGQDSLMTG